VKLLQEYKGTMWLAVAVTPTSKPHRPHITYNQYTTPPTHHLQPVPTSIPHRPHITYNQFQPANHTIHTSPTTSSNQYTTPPTHHLQPVSTSKPHHPHITYMLD